MLVIIQWLVVVCLVPEGVILANVIMVVVRQCILGVLRRLVWLLYVSVPPPLVAGCTRLFFMLYSGIFGVLLVILGTFLSYLPRYGVILRAFCPLVLDLLVIVFFLDSFSKFSNKTKRIKLHYSSVRGRLNAE